MPSGRRSRAHRGYSQAIDSLPPAVIQAFGLQDFGTPAGFLRGNLYELLIPLSFGIAAVVLINGQTASDESAGRLELFLAQPIDRRVLFVARAGACVVALALIVVVTGITQFGSNAIFGLDIDASRVLATLVACGLLAGLFGALAYLLACLRPSPSLVLGGGVGLLLAGYVVAALFDISDVLRPWKVISPWNWALGGNPLENGLEPWRVVALVVPTLLLAILGTFLVKRRDVAAA